MMGSKPFVGYDIQAMHRGHAFRTSDPEYMAAQAALDGISSEHRVWFDIESKAAIAAGRLSEFLNSAETKREYRKVKDAATRCDDLLADFYINIGVTDGATVGMKGAVERALARRAIAFVVIQ